MVSAGAQTEERNAELVQLGVKVKLVTVGKKGATYFKRRLDRFEIAGVLLHCPTASRMCLTRGHALPTHLALVLGTFTSFAFGLVGLMVNGM